MAADAALEEPETWLRTADGETVAAASLEGPPPEGSQGDGRGAESIVPLLQLQAGQRFLGSLRGSGEQDAPGSGDAREGCGL
ncbi:MAG: hypothetical protein QM757_37985 [Paludibaculum sp.]